MRKQILKGLTMFLSVMTLAMITAVVSANGQTVNARASVPFDFVVGDKTLESGDYTVDAISLSGDVVRIRDKSSANAALRLTTTTQGRAGQSRLIFHRYGQQYFLAEVWLGTEGRELSTSKQERAIQKELTRIAAIKAQHTYETVAITLAVK
ncbi:MAG TPA: hypothetical protein VN643_08935 [Pyrinomonadaceae bacterium]|nr:hypothetical protein [Pyrinomonadaceae bacterium]